jgi:tRNA (mo5U34)-methyltransferase
MSAPRGHQLQFARRRAEGDQRDGAATLAAVARNPVWYHTIELPGGVTTPGQIDLRKVAPKLLPPDLRGKRALDVGSFDGFWAFELERRGAEVVAIDIERVEDAQIPPNNRGRVESDARDFGVQMGRGFEIGAELLGSRARRVICDVCELTPEAIGGPVDIAFMGALLIHLRDPVLALERVHGALLPGGELYQLEAISLRLSLLHPRRPVAHQQTLETSFNWWLPNWAALKAWLRTASFGEIQGIGLHHPPQRPPMGNWYRGIRSRAH